MRLRNHGGVGHKTDGKPARGARMKSRGHGYVNGALKRNLEGAHIRMGREEEGGQTFLNIMTKAAIAKKAKHI